MMEPSTSFNIRDLIFWLIGGAVASVVIFLLFAISSELLGSVAISALSAFGAGMSAIVSALLVGIYIKQTNIFKRHGQIMDRQADLMELQYIPEVSPIGQPAFEDDIVEIRLENRGAGPATDLSLRTRIEFKRSEDYDSPLTGISEFERIDDNRAGEGYLSSGDTGTFEADSILEVATLSDELRSRSFRNLISNLESDVEEVRVSLFVESTGKGGDPQKSAILTEEAFYTKLEELDDYSLQECYRVSTPA
jgi:hypothetical protein